MNIKRRHFAIVATILFIGFIGGSFFDLTISKALFHKNDFTGLVFASFGTYPCYMGLAFIGGGLLSASIKRKDLPLWGKVICYFLSALAYFISIYICADDFPSVNGFNNPDLYPLSYALCIITFTPVFVWGFFVCKKGNPQYLWNALIVIAIVYVVGMLPVALLLKLVIHRPRYRLVVRGGLLDFHNWWEWATNYKNFLSGSFVVDGQVITKEEFKSFPSGHSGAGAILMVLLPSLVLFFNKLKGKETLLFYIGFVWALLCMFFRVRVGAHFLTDTCTSSLVILGLFFVLFEYTKARKLLQGPENNAATTPLT